MYIYFMELQDLPSLWRQQTLAIEPSSGQFFHLYPLGRLVENVLIAANLEQPRKTIETVKYLLGCNYHWDTLYAKNWWFIAKNIDFGKAKWGGRMIRIYLETYLCVSIPSFLLEEIKKECRKENGVCVKFHPNP